MAAFAFTESSDAIPVRPLLLRTMFIILLLLSLGLAGLSGKWVFESRADGFQYWWIFVVVAVFAVWLAYKSAREVIEDW